MLFIIRIWRYVRKRGLKTRKRDLLLSAEFLRQQFLLDYSQYRKYSTKQFIKKASWVLKYLPSTDISEDGGFFINPESPLLEPPPAVKHCEPLPKGFGEI